MSSCDVPVGNLGQDCFSDLGYLVAVAITTADPAKTKIEIGTEATWDALLKQDDNRVQLIPADLTEITADEKATETLSGGRDIDRFTNAGEVVVKYDKLSPSVIRTLSTQYDGKTLYYCFIYSKNYIVGRTDSTELNFVWYRGSMSFINELSTEEAANKGRIKFVSNNAKGDTDNYEVVGAGFDVAYDIQSLIDGTLVEVVGSTTSVLKAKFTSKITGSAVPITASEITALANDLIITDSTAGVETLTTVTAGTGTGEVDINFTTPLAADTYTVSLVTPANYTIAGQLSNYEFSSVDIAVA